MPAARSRSAVFLSGCALNQPPRNEIAQGGRRTAQEPKAKRDSSDFQQMRLLRTGLAQRTECLEKCRKRADAGAISCRLPHTPRPGAISGNKKRRKRHL